MLHGSEKRKPDHAIDKLFVDRWSPRAMSGEEIAIEELMTLFEAARWAPSSYNNQPWRILYARRGTEQWPLFFDLLVEGNRAWCANAAALLLFASKNTFDASGQPSKTHSYDCGAAWENLALQGMLRGYVVHGMEGFDYDRAKIVLKIPDGFQVQAMAAVGKPGDPSTLPEMIRARESPNDRKKLPEIVCEGPFRW
jgi:nitroreductase